MSLKEALQDKASEAGTVTVEEAGCRVDNHSQSVDLTQPFFKARELEEERVEQTLILTSSLNQPLEKLLGTLAAKDLCPGRSWKS